MYSQDTSSHKSYNDFGRGGPCPATSDVARTIGRLDGSVEDEAGREVSSACGRGAGCRGVDTREGGVEGNGKGQGGYAADTGVNVGGMSGAVGERWTELLKSAVHVDVCKAFEREGVERGETEFLESNGEEQGGGHSANRWRWCGELLFRVALQLQRAVDQARR